MYVYIYILKIFYILVYTISIYYIMGDAPPNIYWAPSPWSNAWMDTSVRLYAVSSAIQMKEYNTMNGYILYIQA